MTVQFGTFTKQASVANTLSIAESALRDNHFPVLFNAQQGGIVVIGGSAQVMIAVSCAAEGDKGTFVAVSAFSPDSNAAEQARNVVRTSIVNTAIFD